MIEVKDGRLVRAYSRTAEEHFAMVSIIAAIERPESMQTPRVKTLCSRIDMAFNNQYPHAMDF